MATTPQQRPGATIYSVAALAGVSIASVSRVLQGSTAVSDRTRVKVLAAAEQLNYVPLGAARSLAVRHHEAHGLVLPELTGPYYSELLMGFESRAAELGQSVVLMLAGGKADLPRAVRQLAARVDGLAMLGSAAIPESAVQALQGSKPLLLIAGDPREGVEAISAENTESARALTLHLLDHGRRRLLFVGDPGLGPDIRDRYLGFAQAHESGLGERGGRAAAHPLPRGGRHPARRAPPRRGGPRRRAGVCQRRARTVDHGAVAGGRHGRPRGHRRRRLGRRDDRPLRPPRPHHRPPARARARRDGRGPAARAGHRRPPHDGLQVLSTQLVLRASCGCPPAATGIADRPEHLRPAHRLNPTHRPCPRRPVSPPEGEPR